jgi:hypothetical protein
MQRTCFCLGRTHCSLDVVIDVLCDFCSWRSSIGSNFKRSEEYCSAASKLTRCLKKYFCGKFVCVISGWNRSYKSFLFSYKISQVFDQVFTRIQKLHKIVCNYN